MELTAKIIDVYFLVNVCLLNLTQYGTEMKMLRRSVCSELFKIATHMLPNLGSIADTDILKPTEIL
jgi:hypothetical protein